MAITRQEQKNEANKRYYRRNRERILAKFRETSKEVYEKTKDVKLERAKRSRERHYERSMYRNVAGRCKALGIEFDLELSDIVIPDVCPYLKVSLTRTQGEGRVWTNASLDRIDPTKGYVKGNVQVISAKANLMKAHASADELVRFAKSVLEIKEILK